MTRRTGIGIVIALVLALSVPLLAQNELTARRIYLGVTGAACTWHTGTGAPGTGLGAVCDIYKRKDSPYTLYVKTGASTWTPFLSSPWVAAGQVLASQGTGTAPAFTASPSLTSIGGAANLTFDPAGDVVFDNDGNDILPGTGYTKNLGALTNKYLTLHVAELWAETLVAQNTIATIGGRVLVGPTTTLTADLTAGATSIVVKHNQMASGDRVVLQVAGSLEWMAITSGPSGSGPYTYSVTRNLDGSGANAWSAGDAVFNTGAAGDGYIDLYSVNGLLPGSTAGPTIVGNQRTGATYSSVAPRWAIGNCNGLYGYSTNIYCAALGDAANSYLTADATNGIRMIGDQGTMFSMDAAGNATFAGQLTIGTGRNMIANSEFARGRSAGDSDGSVWGGSPSTGDPAAPWTVASGAQSILQRSTPFYGFDKTATPTVDVGTPSASSLPLGLGGFYFLVNGTAAAGSYARAWGPAYAIDPSRRYEFSFYTAGNFGTTGTVRARVVWYTDDGADGGTAPDYVSESDGDTSFACTTAVSGGGSDLSNWCRAWGIYTPPATARLAVVTVLATYVASVASPVVVVTRPFFAEAGASQTQPSAYGTGGQSLITGDMLSTDLVVSNTLRSSGATAFGTGAGFWLDATGTPTFRVGLPGGDRVGFDGTNVEIQSGNLVVDSAGVRIMPTDSAVYLTGRSYGFNVSGGVMGISGSDGLSNGRRMFIENTASGDRDASTQLFVSNTGGTASFVLSATPTGSFVQMNGELLIDAIRLDGTGKVVCIRADTRLGTCNASSITGSGCTCS